MYFTRATRVTRVISDNKDYIQTRALPTRTQAKLNNVSATIQTVLLGSFEHITNIHPKYT